MNPTRSDQIILALKNQYEEKKIVYDEMRCDVYDEDSISNRGFMGSRRILNITSAQSILHQAPACIAAPIVEIVAKNAIVLIGSPMAIPVRIFAPSKLTLKADELVLGNLSFVTQPQEGYIECKKLRLLKDEGKDSDWFNLIESWLAIDPQVIIEEVT